MRLKLHHSPPINLTVTAPGADGMALVRTHLAPLITDAEAADRLLAALRARAALFGPECRITSVRR